MHNAFRYFRTLRYLKPVQVYGRFWHRLYHPKVNFASPPALRPLSNPWITPAIKTPSLIAPCRFRFLNEEHDLSAPADWNRPDWAKLWLYNLHYFDDLNAAQAVLRVAWHRTLLTRWVTENKPGTGNGWEPYPLSLRIVNWIKWALAGNVLPAAAFQSLAIQIRFLSQRLEYHLLGNHLLANAKALIFAGCFFEGPEADAWMDKGLKIFTDEIPVQVLSDGGHFELSPMYHSVILEDLLDLVNVFKCYPPRSSTTPVCAAAKRMLDWLRVMCHSDGQIALFNDAALAIATNPEELYAYAERLGIRQPAVSAMPQKQRTVSNMAVSSFGNIKLIHLQTSGYIRVENGPAIAFLDVAAVGPDYLPGHAHADTLTFEMSFDGQRVVVNSGTSLYGDGSMRLKQRGTAAHNTVMVDGKDSSEVWGSFRVARRAKPFGLEIKGTTSGVVCVRCAHDGYRRLSGKPIHCREWHFEEHALMINDVVEGKFRDAVSRFHFHPAVNIRRNDNLLSICLPSGQTISCHIKKGQGQLIKTTYHPEFGVSYENQCLEVQLNNNKSQIIFNWP